MARVFECSGPRTRSSMGSSAANWSRAPAASPGLPGPHRRGWRGRSGFPGALRAEDPPDHRDQRGELVAGPGRVPRPSGPVGEVGAVDQGFRVLRAEDPPRSPGPARRTGRGPRPRPPPPRSSGRGCYGRPGFSGAPARTRSSMGSSSAYRSRAAAASPASRSRGPAHSGDGQGGGVLGPRTRSSMGSSSAYRSRAPAGPRLPVQWASCYGWSGCPGAPGRGRAPRWAAARRTGRGPRPRPPPPGPAGGLARAIRVHGCWGPRDRSRAFKTRCQRSSAAA